MSFEKDVIERSQELPVMVDFWAPWCGPCRVLGPVLESLAEEQRGRWALVKINTEEDQATASRFNIRSIPHVKLFHRGEVVGEFTGALTRPMVEKFLEEHLPNPALMDLQALLLDYPDGSPELVEQLERLLEAHPQEPAIALALALRLVWSRPEEALALIDAATPGSKTNAQAEDVRTLVELVGISEGKEPVVQHLNKAKSALQRGSQEDGIGQIIAAVVADKHYANDLPRRAAVALFRLWGEQHPLTQGHRRAFSMALN
ncbi:MAG: tetratricopeptide repeat protein [Saprospiraceae bacterium]|nr:tetratricopeptide repeat protein [Saprospiraceae bacterium]